MPAMARRHGGSPAGKSYMTAFGATENPLSQGGLWTNGGVFSDGAASKTNMQSGANGAYGTMVSFDGTNYIDSCACLSGFTGNHSTQGTIANAGGFSGFSLELELLLNATITSSVVTLYEVDCVFGGPGIDLVRWDMSLGSPNAFTTLRNRVDGEVPFNNGDQVYASKSGTLITVRYKSSGGAFSTLFTYDTVNDATKYTGGNPGIGAWNQTGNAGDESLFAWSSFTAIDLD